MNWLELVATVVGIAVAIFTLGKYVNDLYKVMKNGGDLKSWFSYGRKVKGLKYLRVFQKRSALGSRTEISNSVRQQLTREIAKDVIHSYCIGRRVSRISRSSRDQLGIVFSVFGLFGIVVASAVLRKITNVAPAKQELINSVIIMLSFWIVAMLCVLALQLIVLVWRLVDDHKSTSELIRLQVVQVPLDSIPYCVEKDKDYIFLDATIRERYQVPFMGAEDRVQMLLDHGVATDGDVALKKSEAKQVKSSDCEDVAGKLVDSFLSKTSKHGSEPVYFVFSQAGITAALVTHLLRSKGLRAFYIGATNGYESEVRETIREIRILRESGLI
ncbi:MULTISPECIES: hypothetical protein [Actinomycetaceae]|uniref:hypothetical protein n=1 Tax=Actinomycetaceae TaxID=2049 RepID=UPI001E4E535E|nr:MULTISPECIES: hypothetical protein [Actinomycetaceae]WLD78010.1 hypothetical protein QU663_10420 [Schaalia sp. HMT-172]